MKAYKPGHRALRKGRHSIPYQIYLVTTTTQQRQPFFTEWYAAQAACRCFHNPSLIGDASMLAWVLMPDHAHWMIQLCGEIQLAEVIKRLKSASGLQVNRLLGRSGGLWSRAYHERALRSDENIRSAARYLIANPLRAGLVRNIGDYPFWNAAWL